MSARRDENEDDIEYYATSADIPVSARCARDEALAKSLGITVVPEGSPPHCAGAAAARSAPRSPGRSVLVASVVVPPMEGGALPLTLARYKELCGLALKEFWLEKDFDEVRRCYDEWRAPFFGDVFVRRLVSGAMERGDGERECASRLLSAMYGAELSMEQVGRGFCGLLAALPELELDLPAARELCAKFLARAVSDEVLPPGFMTDPRVTRLAPEVAGEARALLSRAHSAERLEHCWGVAGGVADMPALKAAVRAAVAEFASSHDAREALRQLRSLEAPAYGHEVAYRLALAAVDDAGAPAAGRAVALLGDLARALVVSRHQATLGFRRAAGALPDAALDSPHARGAFRALAAAATAAGVLPEAWQEPARAEEAPAEGAEV